jgi:hypothetical protein
MGETVVCSPISRKGSKVGSSQLRPGARSSPSRGDTGEPEPKAEQQEQEPREQPAVATHVHLHADPEPEPQERGDSLVQRFADRIMGRRRAASYRFTNFPQ